ncbi:hypothetical protein GDO86_016378 [Hymenochirus boettgeri]|uniref:Uncharacterized protein n=1 Tax=Hymenochirus boettgeri TaxID=247094 RepID=A0A8T2K279_9PIPI|nr:hypothetical protein GDO86_016378 [Hymenochirus boettgeri]
MNQQEMCIKQGLRTELTTLNWQQEAAGRKGLNWTDHVISLQSCAPVHACRHVCAQEDLRAHQQYQEEPGPHGACPHVSTSLHVDAGARLLADLLAKGGLKP